MLSKRLMRLFNAVLFVWLALAACKKSPRLVAPTTQEGGKATPAAGEQGWQGTAWALERLYPHRFARPEVMNQIAVVNQGDKVSTERVIVLPGEEFDALIDRPGYHLCENGDLERREGSLVYVMVRQRNQALPMRE